MLLTEAYREEQRILHSRGNYGTASLQYGGLVTDLLNQSGAKTLLDYGCGSMQNLTKVIRPNHDVEYRGYDPGVSEYSGDPEPADLVVCIDVLEHIEPECLDSVLDHLKTLSPVFMFATVHTGPAVKTLSDGRNAHLIQEPPKWWLPRLMERWELQNFQRTGKGFQVLCRSLAIAN